MKNLGSQMTPLQGLKILHSYTMYIGNCLKNLLKNYKTNFNRSW